MVSLKRSLLSNSFFMKKLLLLLASVSVLFSPAIFAADSTEPQDPGITTTSVASPSLSRNIENSKMISNLKFDEPPHSTSGAGIVGIVLQLAFYLFFSYCLYLLATKLGEEYTWLAFVPILSIVLFFRMAKMSLWWILGLFIPLFNICVIIKMIHQGITLRTGHSGFWTA